MRSSVARKLSLFLGLLFFALLALMAALPNPREHDERSLFSLEADGTRLLFLVTEELGFDVSPWIEAPGELPRGNVALVLTDVPVEPPAYDAGEGSAVEGGPPPVTRRLRDPLHYQRFVEEGGTLLVEGTPELLEFLTVRLGLQQLGDLKPTATGSRVTLASDEILRLEGKVTSYEELPWESELEVLAVDQRGRPVVTELVHGRGRVLVFPEAAPFQNDVIDAKDNLLFWVRLLELAAPAEELYFDEYALGGWSPDSKLQLAFGPRFAPVTLHFVCFLSVLLWSLVWVRAFPRDPEALEQLSALDRARSFGSLLERAGRWDVLSSMLRWGVLRGLGTRASALAVREARDGSGGEPDAELVQTVLQPLAGRFRDDAELEAARALLLNATVVTEDDLDHQAAELARLERRVATLRDATPGN